ncbi:hypothetical protein [Streptomyces sp. cg36]|uniref:hypothetical protein n=1 Tax=Streptomyces sp. cg36 TaxID=3238798 RepID=UPI0034E20950
MEDALTMADRLDLIGVDVVELAELNWPEDPDVHGLALMYLPTDDSPHLGARLVVRPGQTPETLQRIYTWAVGVFERIGEHGPEPDGWHERSDGNYQLWVRQVEVPSLD